MAVSQLSTLHIQYSRPPVSVQQSLHSVQQTPRFSTAVPPFSTADPPFQYSSPAIQYSRPPFQYSRPPASVLLPIILHFTLYIFQAAHFANRPVPLVPPVPQPPTLPLRWGNPNPSLGEAKTLVGADPHPRKGSQPTAQGHRRHANRATQKSVQGRSKVRTGEMPNPRRGDGQSQKAR